MRYGVRRILGKKGGQPRAREKLTKKKKREPTRDYNRTSTRNASKGKNRKKCLGNRCFLMGGKYNLSSSIRKGRRTKEKLGKGNSGSKERLGCLYKVLKKTQKWAAMRWAQGRRLAFLTRKWTGGTRRKSTSGEKSQKVNRGSYRTSEGRAGECRKGQEGTIQIQDKRE